MYPNLKLTDTVINDRPSEPVEDQRCLVGSRCEPVAMVVLGVGWNGEQDTFVARHTVSVLQRVASAPWWVRARAEGRALKVEQVYGSD